MVIQSRKSLFPTHVGVSLFAIICTYLKETLPHTRGGVPHERQTVIGHNCSSPHTWGCPYKFWNNFIKEKLFPTHVGVSLVNNPLSYKEFSLPHTRGGVPIISIVPLLVPFSSPHTWGCPCPICHLFPKPFLFPTHVGVSLK